MAFGLLTLQAPEGIESKHDAKKFLMEYRSVFKAESDEESVPGRE